MAALPWLLPRARAVLTSDATQVRRSGLEKVRLQDGKLNNAMILSAAAAVGRVWRGGAKVASTKNKAIDYVLLDAIDRPFRDDPDAAEKAGKGVFKAVGEIEPKAARLVRACKDAELSVLLSAPWCSAAYAAAPPESPQTGAKRPREEGAAMPPPPPPSLRLDSPAVTTLDSPAVTADAFEATLAGLKAMLSKPLPSKPPWPLLQPPLQPPELPPSALAFVTQAYQQDVAEREAQWNDERSALEAKVAHLEAALKQEKSDAAALAKSVREAFEKVEAWQSDNQLPSHIKSGSEKWSREHGWLHWHEPEKAKTDCCCTVCIARGWFREPWIAERSHRARVESERKEAKGEKRRALAAISE